MLRQVGTSDTGKTSLKGSEFSEGPPRWSGLEPCEERLQEGGLLSLGRGWLRGHLPATCQCLREGYGGDRARPFMLVCGRRARGSSGKLRQERLRVVQGRTFPMRWSSSAVGA